MARAGADVQAIGAHDRRVLATGYLKLLSTVHGARTYLYIYLNAMFHSGVFTWLGVLLHDRFRLGEAGIGLALLGYGVPGLFLGPTIGKIVDRSGRPNERSRNRERFYADR